MTKVWNDPESTIMRWVRTLMKGSPPEHPTLDAYPTERTMKTLYLLREEVEELIEAYEERDLEHVAHEWTDVEWVVHQLGMVWGLPRKALMRAVAKANYTKINPDTGEFYRDNNGRIAKGPNYVKPDIKSALEESV